MSIVTEVGSFPEAVAAAMELDAPLNERMQMVADALQRFRPADAEIIGRLVTRLKDSRVGAGAPAVGDRMPGFVLPDEEGRTMRLGELLRSGPLVIAFHRGHWCPYCRLAALGLARAQDQVKETGAEIVAVVPERSDYARQMKATAGARFPFLIDAANGYALSLNLAVWVGMEVEATMTRAGIDLPRFQGNPAWFLPLPATFVVGSDGIVAARYVDPDHRRRMEIDDILSALEGMR